MVVVDIEKPKSCADCLFTGIEGDQMHCLLTGMTISCMTDHCKGKCPLISEGSPEWEKIIGKSEIKKGTDMTTYEFEKISKNAVIKVMKEQYGMELTIQELEFVWFAHELGFKKCTLYAAKLGHYYPEVTYNRDKNELYVDVYLKQSNTKIEAKDFDMEAYV